MKVNDMFSNRQSAAGNQKFLYVAVDRVSKCLIFHQQITGFNDELNNIWVAEEISKTFISVPYSEKCI